MNQGSPSSAAQPSSLGSGDASASAEQKAPSPPRIRISGQPLRRPCNNCTSCRRYPGILSMTVCPGCQTCERMASAPPPFSRSDEHHRIILEYGYRHRNTPPNPFSLPVSPPQSNSSLPNLPSLIPNPSHTSLIPPSRQSQPPLLPPPPPSNPPPSLSLPRSPPLPQPLPSRPPTPPSSGIAAGGRGGVGMRWGLEESRAGRAGRAVTARGPFP